MIEKFLSAMAALALIVNASASRAEQNYSYTTINVPPSFNYPSSNNGTAAWAINNESQVVGAYYTCCVREEGGFLLSGGAYTAINSPNDPYTDLTGINDLGDIVGNAGTVSSPHSFLYNGVNFTTIDYPNASFTGASGINDSGNIVGYYSSSTITNGFIKIGDNYTPISDPIAIATYASGINNANDIVGWYTYDNLGDSSGFIYNGSQFTTIVDPSSIAGTTAAFGVNDAGQVVGVYSNDSGVHGFLLDQGHYITLDDPLANGTTVASGINNAGDIVGYYRDIDGGLYGFIATPIPGAVPEPSTWAMMLIGFAGLGFAGYRVSRPTTRAGGFRSETQA